MKFTQLKITRTIAVTGLSLLCLNAVAQTKFPVKTLSAGVYAIQAEVAETAQERELGLMYRTKMAPQEGMVFDFGKPTPVCMWMKNTYLPLSVAFIDEQGTIVNIEDMQPQTTDSHCSKKSVPFALEMNKGWFKQKGIGPGDKIAGFPQAK